MTDIAEVTLSGYTNRQEHTNQVYVYFYKNVTCIKKN